MSKNNGKSSLKVCLLSPHPMVLDEFHRLLEDSGFQITSKQLDSMLAPDLRNLEVPKASVYVVDAHAARQATGALLGNILDTLSGARLLVVGDKLKEADSHALLRQGVKGILTYDEAREQLARALPQVAAGRHLGAAPGAFPLRGFDPEQHAGTPPARRFPERTQPPRAGSPQRSAGKSRQ